MTLINKIITWWHYRRFRKVAAQAMGTLVTEGTSPIKVKRFKKNETHLALTIPMIKDEPIKATVLHSSEHAIRSTSWDSKVPSCVKHIEFDEDGEIVTETHITLEKSEENDV